jgi:hypothetical protein
MQPLLPITTNLPAMSIPHYANLSILFLLINCFILNLDALKPKRYLQQKRKSPALKKEKFVVMLD